ncbi:uncharacterized protein HaLaN_06629 [Haematococcus lacustris]|uniref:Uncharacterized protein n=1 Tax=Haematococcus lacustris TaxID=44745 RepID=A0A699YM35_HAELA|nr:uncharacterized protein HaLaN_06629 [Haematococcus lacustris]
MAEMVDLEGLKQRLTRLGVQLGTSAHALEAPRPAASPRPDIDLGPRHATYPPQDNATNMVSQRPESGVADILHKIHSAEADLQSASKIDQMTAQRFVEEVAAIRKSPEAARKWVVPVPHAHGFCSKRGSDEFYMDATWLPCRLVRPVKARGVRSPGRPGGGAAVRGALGSAPAGGARNAFQPRGAGGKSADLLRGVPQHTPLSSVLHQYRDAEVSWAHDKAQLRRDSEDSKRRALKAEADLRKLSRLAESRSLDIKALRTALRNRDVQLEASADRIKELEGLLIRSQEDGAIRAATLSAERDDCKALLLATLQRLEAVDEVVHRADMSSAMMQDKMKSLEDERLRALEAAARARAEVADLTESRRKLQWQSKLLEKMSEGTPSVLCSSVSSQLRSHELMSASKGGVACVGHSR